MSLFLLLGALVLVHVLMLGVAALADLGDEPHDGADTDARALAEGVWIGLAASATLGSILLPMWGWSREGRTLAAMLPAALLFAAAILAAPPRRKDP